MCLYNIHSWQFVLVRLCIVCVTVVIEGSRWFKSERRMLGGRGRKRKAEVMYLYFDLFFYLKNPLESKCLKFQFNTFIRTFC